MRQTNQAKRATNYDRYGSLSDRALAVMKTNSIIEQEVLGMCADDYEAPHTIASDLSRVLGHAVTEQEIRDALLALAAKEAVQAYMFDGAIDRYVPISSAAAAHSSDVWFMVKK